uniref:Uncharacterized protein n=1 Tax=Bosea sp. NBC_00436 TaxID=2969620 RepID=A0A9E8CT84_9HYPH
MGVVFIIAFGLLIKNPLALPLLIGASVLGSVFLQSFLATFILLCIALVIAALTNEMFDVSAVSMSRNLEIVPFQILLFAPVALLLHFFLRRIRPRDGRSLS